MGNRTHLHLLSRLLLGVSDEPDIDWQAMADLAREYGLTPLLYWRARERQNQAPAAVPEDVWAALVEGWYLALSRAMMAEQRLGRVLGALAEAGVPALVVKGPPSRPSIPTRRCASTATWTSWCQKHSWRQQKRPWQASATEWRRQRNGCGSAIFIPRRVGAGVLARTVAARVSQRLKAAMEDFQIIVQSNKPQVAPPNSVCYNCSHILAKRNRGLFPWN